MSEFPAMLPTTVPDKAEYLLRLQHAIAAIAQAMSDFNDKHGELTLLEWDMVFSYIVSHLIEKLADEHEQGPLHA